MPENGQLAPVEYLTDDLAKELNRSEHEVRIAAKKHGLSAPYNATEADTIRAELTSQKQPSPPEPQDAIAPGADAKRTLPNHQEAPPFFSQYCDALEAEIAKKLSEEMLSRMPSIKEAVYNSLLSEKE